jgi:diacylglycerol kinase (ATP)
MKAAVILNPTAGSVKNLEAITNQLRQLGDIHICHAAGDAEGMAREFSVSHNLVVSAGGDGTLNEVVNGMAAANCVATLGIVPLGTGNDFARTLGVTTDVGAAIEQIMTGRTQPIDLVQVTSDQVRYFINVSSGGFSGLVNEKLTPEMKRTWGPLAYLRSAAAAFPQLRGYTTRVAIDDTAAQELDLYNVVVANGRYVAGGIPIAPEAAISDGLFDVVLIPERGPADLALLAAQILVGKHLSSDAIIFHRAKRLTISSRPGMWFNVDGEVIGNEPATFDLLPGALRCVVSST